MADGADGWDAYAPFYDWENARTLGRRDVPFWRRVVQRERARVLELGCGTGRLLLPLVRAGAAITGVDRSAPMLARAQARLRRLSRRKRSRLVRGDIRALPFPTGHFGVVLAPYGMLQSLLRDRDFDRALGEAARMLRPGGLLGIDLVPDLPKWDEYRKVQRLKGKGPGGSTVSLVESVRQDRRRGLTRFDEEFVLRRGKRQSVQRFSLTFRTRSMKATIARLARAGFEVEALLGDYRGGPWDPRADVWVILARRSGK